MKAKAFLTIIINCGFLAIFANVVMGLIGVEMTGAEWAKAITFVMFAFFGIVMWEFALSITKGK